MPRIVHDATRARGSLAIDPKTNDGLWETPPERVTAWDEDETTLAIEAAAALPRAPLTLVSPAIHADTLRIALDLADVQTAADPLALARRLTGPVLAIHNPPGSTIAHAHLVDEGNGPEPTPRDVSPPPRMVSAARALAESRRIPPPEPMPDTPMGAYVPWGTWIEDLPARLRLLAQRCETCGRTQYPPRAACVTCRGTRFAAHTLPPSAELYAATRIGRGGAPSEFALEQAQAGAYWVGVVEWPRDGVRVTARLAGIAEEAPAIGTALRPVVRRLFEQEGRVRYGVKFIVR